VAIVLHAHDPAHVSSPSSFEVEIGDPARQLVIFSGIAMPGFRVNHDEEPSGTEVLVKLGMVVAGVDRATAHVGLASIQNDETAFLFAADAVSVHAEEGTGELTLRVAVAAMGEHTYLHRFGYQVVAHVRRVIARISGTIRVPRDILDIEDWSREDLAALFAITANRVERAAPSGDMQFANDRLIPVAFGHVDSVRGANRDNFVEYHIDGCPFTLPLIVDVKLRGPLDRVGVTAGQASGPRPVVLTNAEPDADVDFAVARFRGPN
jgi:hypothetical protein